MIVDPPGEPTASSGLPSRSTIVGLIELRGRLPPSTRFGCVSESEVEVGELVVREEAESRDDQAGAAGRLDRERVRDDVAPAVGGRDVRGRARARLARRGLDARAAAAVERIGIAGRDRARRRGSRDQGAPGGREPVREQSRQRDVEVGRIGEIGAAVGERVARGLEEVVQRRLPRSSSRAGSPRGCSAPRRRSSRRSRAGPCCTRRGRGSRRASAPAPARCRCAGPAWSSAPAARCGWRSATRPGAERSRRARPRPRRGRSPSPRGARSARTCARGRGCGRRCRRRAACRPGRGRARRSQGCR